MNSKSLIPKQTAACLALCVLSVLLSGCAWSIGGEKGETLVQPTQGQELIDLQRAHEQGIITTEEYEQQKKRVLDR